MKTTQFEKLVLVSAVSALLVACGGGGGGGSTPAPAPSPVVCTAPAVNQNGVCVTPAVPLKVQATSYLNAKNLNIPAQKYPKFTYNAANGYSEGATGGVAYGDFFGEGKISMVAFSNRWNDDQTKRNYVGKVYFYKFDANGNPVDNTSAILSNNTGCEAPRKVIVADFNGDGKPDVFASCTGAEFGADSTWTGEHPRILLSQPNGTYTNEDAGFNCYCHSAAAADLNGDGKVDIITSDLLVSIGSRGSPSKPSTVMVLTNDGTGKFAVKHDYNYEVVPKEAFRMTLPDGNPYDANGPMWTVELVPSVSGGTQPDLIIGSSQDATAVGAQNYFVPHWILSNNGNGTFSTLASFHGTGDTDYWGLDIIVRGTDVYVYGANMIPGGAYDYIKVIKYNINTKVTSTIWNSGTQTVNDFVWMMPYSNNLVPYDAKYGVNIPMQ